MLKIYGVLRSRATRNVWLAREVGIPFERIDVVQANRLPAPDAPDAPLNTRSAAFLAINPHGHIPAIDDDGLRLGESFAINLYLARKHGGPLAPRDLAEDAQMTMWSMWAMADVEPHALSVMYNRVAKPEAERDAAAAKAGVLALERPFATLEAHLAASGGHLVGGRFTVADLNVAEAFRYAQAAPELFRPAPHVTAWLAACQARPHADDCRAQRRAGLARPPRYARPVMAGTPRP